MAVRVACSGLGVVGKAVKHGDDLGEGRSNQYLFVAELGLL